MILSLLFKKKKETIEGIEEEIKKKGQEFDTLLYSKGPEIDSKNFISEKGKEFFKARPELSNNKDSYKAREYRLYLAEQLRYSIAWDYARWFQCQESEETKVLNEKEKKKQ
jgi:hypothetical protein